MTKDLIFVVDDDPSILQLITVWLERKYLVQTFAFANDALQALKEKNVSLAIVDLFLPDLNGLELIRQIEEMRPGISIIMISGMPTEDALLEACKIGVYTFLEKPFQKEKFITEVDNALDNFKHRLLPQKTKEESEGTILIVDDHLPTRELLQEILGRRGYFTKTCVDGEEAIKIVTQEDFDIVLMDIHMPKLSGIDAVKEIKKIKPKTFIVMMTGEADEVEKNSALQLDPGHYAVLRKPFHLAEFLVSIKHLKKESKEYKEEKEKQQQFEKKDVLTKAVIKGAEEIKTIAKTQKQNIQLWVKVVFISLLLAVGSYIFIGSFREVVNVQFSKMGSFMNKVEGYLQRDEQRELHKDN